MRAELEHAANPFAYGRDQWPERARVRGPVPIGIGTAWVESMSGYTTRMAADLGLSPRRLMERVIAGTLGDPDRPGWSQADIARFYRSVSSHGAAAINGAWLTARTYTDLLSRATLQPGLDELTVLAWADRLNNRGLLRRLRAYCPVCLHDWARDGRPSYEPLRWQFRVLEICVAHEVRLRTACATPGCGRERLIAAGWASIERCVGCRQPLAQTLEQVWASESSPAPDALDWGRFVDAQLGDILAHRPSGPLPPYRFPELLEVAIEGAGRGVQRAFAERVRMTEASVSYWKDDRRRPSLTALLRVCRVSGFHLFDVLMGNLEAAIGTPAPVDVPFVPPSDESHAAVDHTAVAGLLYEALAEEPPVSLARAIARTGVTREHVQRRHRALAVAIRERYATWRAADAESRARAREQVLLDAIASLDELDVYPSRNQLRKILPPGLRLIDGPLVALWRRTLIDLGWGDPSLLRRVKGEPTREPVGKRARRPGVARGLGADRR